MSGWRNNPVHIIRMELLAEQAARPATHQPAKRRCLGC